MPLLQDTMGTGGAATLGRDDRSGLLDIRALSSAIDAQRRAQHSASASSVALPSFTTPWTTQDLRPVPSPQLGAPLSGPAPNRLLYGMVAALGITVASLGAYVVLRPPPTPTVAVEAALAGTLTEDIQGEIAAPTPEPDAEPEPESLVAAVEIPEAGEELEAAATKSPRSRVRRSRSNGSRVQSTAKPAATPAPSKKKDSVSVECVLDPSKCGKARSSNKASKTASTAELPATPNSSQVRSAMLKVKPAAKKCGANNGMGAGDKVQVKLSVVGATGRITSAKAIGEHAGTAAGRCVERALSKATLPRFSKKQVGIVYSVRM